MATNVELTAEEGNGHFFGYHSDGETSEMQFLTNVRYCPDAGAFNAYRIYGDLVPAEEFKSAVEEFVATDPSVDHVLYNIHGFNVDPEASFHGASNFAQDHSDTGYLVIPISWRNHWGKSPASYDICRNTMAPPAGLQLARQFDVFKTSVPVSLMAHSMGNWVTRIFAQNIENPEVVFENFFSVAADARMDMFGTDFNPAAPRDQESNGNTETESAGVYVGIPAIELVENGGYAITNIARHIHVYWNSEDRALLFREAMQISNVEHADRVRKALGRVGDQSKELTTLPYFQERVCYHDFSTIIGSSVMMGHSYPWSAATVAEYAARKDETQLSDDCWESTVSIAVE